MTGGAALAFFQKQGLSNPTLDDYAYSIPLQSRSLA
jgi:hypothetical protein